MMYSTSKVEGAGEPSADRVAKVLEAGRLTRRSLLGVSAAASRRRVGPIAKQ